MRIWKLISGILSIVLSLFVFFQSSIAGLGNALEDNGEVSGSAGMFVSIFMLTAGIVSIVVHNKTGKGGSIALILLFGLASLLGFGMAGSYGDLRIWAGWCLICAVMALISLFIKPKQKKSTDVAGSPAEDNNYKPPESK